MIRVYKKKVCPTRDVELIKKSRIKQLHTAIIGSESYYNKSLELTMLEYITLIIIFECSLGNIIMFVELVVKHGPFFVILAYILITVTVTMPLHMLLTFMGSYSKLSYISMFSCAPVFEGLGYVVAWIRISNELYSCSIAATSLLIFYHCLSSQFKATFCHGIIQSTRKGVTCLTMYPKTFYNYTCTSTNMVNHYTATQYYIKTKVFNFDLLKQSQLPVVNQPLLTSQFLAWLLIFVLSLSGIKRLKSVTINLYFVFGLVMILSIFISLCYGHESVFVKRTIMFGLKSNLFTSDFWSDIFLYAVRPTGFASIIWLATIKPKSVDTKFAIILASHLKIVIFSLVACISSLICEEILYYFKIVDSNCLATTGFHIIFAFIPDILDRTGIRRLTVPVWYMGLFCMAFLAPLYSVISFTDSITQRFPVLSRYKLYVYSIICSGSFLLNVILLTSVGGYFVSVYKRCSKPFVVSGLFLLYNMVLFFAYSSRSILDDYLFTFGVKPEKYWTTFWKSSPIFAISIFIFVAYNHEYNSPMCSKRGYIVILTYMYTVLTFSPVFLIGIYRCCIKRGKAEENRRKKIKEWGPFDSVDRKNRKMFFPQREVRYRMTTIKCKHRCSCSFPADYQKWVRIEHIKLDKLEFDWNRYLENKISLEEKSLTRSEISSDSSML